MLNVYIVPVLMHLLALGAFRPLGTSRTPPSSMGLNAPYGARCFLTERKRVVVFLDELS